MSLLPPMRFVGAKVLGKNEIQARSLSIREGRIVEDSLPEVDVSGFLIAPGIVDLHGDGFERHLLPRPTAPFPLGLGLDSFAREAAAQGITTAYMAQSWSWEGAQRSPEATEALLNALDLFRPNALIDLRVQIRAETHLVAETDRLLAVVERHGIDFVIFNNHLAEGLAMASSSPDRFEAWARRIGRSTDDLLAAIRDAQAATPMVARSLCRLAEGFDRLGVTYGSHDDPDTLTREKFRMLGATVAEFPLSHTVAAAAHFMDSPVMMGAPNVVRGGSQAGNVSAMDMIRAGRCDALVSDYYLPAMTAAVWKLVDDEVMDLPRAWALVSTNPAEILNLTDRGRLERGKRADLVLINEATRQVEATVSGGRLAWMAGEAGSRLASALGSGRQDRVAAE